MGNLNPIKTPSVYKQKEETAVMREVTGMWQLIVIGLAIDCDGWAGFMKIL
jgi:hypothetical protein